jgi:flagellar basal-body rod modification protein FlgD
VTQEKDSKMTTTTNPTSNSAQAIYAALNGSGTKTATGASSASQAQQDRFLKLLTTQLKNQDPLNPLDNAQMTSQLAQISTVDGIEKLNATLQTLLSNANDTQTMQAAALVGHGVLIAGSALQLGQAGALGGVDLATPADQAKVAIKDANGLVVRTLDLGSLDAGTHNFTWDGTTDSGAAAATGAYTFAITALRGGNPVTASALQLGVVSSVTRTTTGFNLDLGALGQFGMADLKQIL